MIAVGRSYAFYGMAPLKFSHLQYVNKIYTEKRKNSWRPACTGYRHLCVKGKVEKQSSIPGKERIELKLKAYIKYLNTLIGLVEKVRDTQSEKFEEAADIIARAIIEKRMVHFWGLGVIRPFLQKM